MKCAFFLRRHMNRTEQQNHSLQVAVTEYLIEIIIYVKCVDQTEM